MKTRIRACLAAACGVIAAALVPKIAGADGVGDFNNTVPGSDGRSIYGTDYCFVVSWTGAYNTCGAGTTATEHYVLPLQRFGSNNNGTFHFYANIWGQYQQTGPWASCVTVGENGDYYVISSRQNTTSTTTQRNFLAFGSTTSTNDYGLYLDCDATYGVNIMNASWASFLNP